MKHTTVKAAPTPKKSASHTGTHRVEISKAENGFTVRSHKNSGDGPYMEPDEHVFNSPEEMGAHVMSQFGSAPAKDVKKAAGGK